MGRYFLELAYNGSRFSGYQIQPNAPSIQENIEQALSTILREAISIVGCGRTDAGVHAKQYFAHFDASKPVSNQILKGLNRLVGHDIAIYNVIPVHAEAHARFDATSRSYYYNIDLQKNPFDRETAYYWPAAKKFDFEKLQQAATLLLEYTEFETFCKTGTDAKTRTCRLKRSEWEWLPDQQRLCYHVTADRFLRGMIRLIVGMCIRVCEGKISLEEVRKALEEQKTLKHALSAPPQGLFLTDIQYDYIST